MKPKIDISSTLLTSKEIKELEDKYNAQYICESCLPVFENGILVGWHNKPACFFWTPKAHPEGSNYFCLFVKLDEQTNKSALYISNGISIVNQTIEAITDGKLVIYSRHRHDFRSFPKSSPCKASIDGGRDYTRVLYETDNQPERVVLQVNQKTHKLEITEIAQNADSLIVGTSF
jgi:hypothetical protein